MSWVAWGKKVQNKNKIQNITCFYAQLEFAEIIDVFNLWVLYVQKCPNNRIIIEIIFKQL